MKPGNDALYQIPALDRIPALLARLTSRPREVIRPVFEQPGKYVLFSLRSLSRSLHSDPANLLRAVQAMGFKRYRDFQWYLHELSVATATSLDAMKQIDRRNGGMAALIQDSIKRDMDSLKTLFNSLDPARVIALVRKLYGARRILIFCGDMDASLAYYLEYNLAMLGLNAVAATTAGEITHRVRHVGRRDTVVAITYRRGLRQVIEGVVQAHLQGAHCAGISDSIVSPLAHHCDQLFITSTDGASFADSYVAGMAFLNALLVGCANYRRARTLSIMRKAAEEQTTGFRWYSHPGKNSRKSSRPSSRSWAQSTPRRSVSR